MSKMSKQNAGLFGGASTGELFTRALAIGLGSLVAEYDAANAPAETTVVASGRKATGAKRGPKPGAKRGRPAGTGAKRGRPPGAKAKAKPARKSAATGAKRGRKSNAEKAAIEAREAAKAKRAKARKAGPVKTARKAKAKPAAAVAAS